jgi:hypothetical protein
MRSAHAPRRPDRRCQSNQPPGKCQPFGGVSVKEQAAKPRQLNRIGREVNETSACPPSKAVVGRSRNCRATTACDDTRIGGSSFAWRRAQPTTISLIWIWGEMSV